MKVARRVKTLAIWLQLPSNEKNSDTVNAVLIYTPLQKEEILEHYYDTKK